MLVLAAAVAVAWPATQPPSTSAATKIVVRGTLKSLRGLTATYTSSKGTYSATWIGQRHYQLRGTITGRRFTGTIRTRQAPGGTRYHASGSGRLGSRAVHISGGGPDNLRTATLVLR